MTVRLNESVLLGAPDASGAWSVVLITEGVGSTGVYSSELLQNSPDVFENVPSFLNHPQYGWADERDVNTLAGRISNVRFGESDGKAALLANFTPRAEYKQFIEDFGDLVGLSIFCGAYGTELPNGRIEVTEFDKNDPYRSVDIVVAAGRGGRFERAQESLRVIESALGITAEDTKPGSDLLREKEETLMEEKIDQILSAVEALTAGFQAKAEEEVQASVDAEALAAAAESAVQAFDEKRIAIESAELLPSQKQTLIESARRGEDITEALESAVRVYTESKEHFAASAPDTKEYRVGEDASVKDARDLLPAGWSK